MIVGPRPFHLTGVRKPSSNLMVLLTLLVAAGIVGVVIWRSGEKAPGLRVGFQDADPPLGMPAKGEVDHRFHFLSAWQTVQIPKGVEV